MVPCRVMDRCKQSVVNTGRAARPDTSRIWLSKEFIALLERVEVARVGTRYRVDPTGERLRRHDR
jgi:hypothetical protein